MANLNEEARIPVYLNDQQAKSALKNLQGEADRWRKKMHKAMVEGNPKGVKEAEREMKKAQKAANQLKRETFDYNKVLKNLSSASIEDLTKTFRQLRKQQKGLNRDTKEYVAIQRKIDAVKGEFRKINGHVTKQRGLLGKLKGAAGGLLPAFGFAAIIGGAVALGKKIFNLAKNTIEYRKQIQKLTGESGQSLADLSAKVEATANTFKKDFKTLAVANHNFAASMKISEERANDLINKGFLAGADASDEFLDRLREYGPQFQAAGISAEQAIAIMTQEVRSGVYSDKGTDAIKEATIAIREMTPVTREAIEGIGLSSAKLEADLRSGAISYFDAIQMISNKMAELPPQSTEVGTALADIFKGAGEDAGLDYITMLGNVEGSMDKLVEGAGETAEGQQKLLDANQRLSKAWSDMLGTGTGTFTAINASAKVLLADGLEGIVKGIADIRDWFIELYNGSAAFRGYLQWFIATWKTAITIVKTSLQSLWEQLKLVGRLFKSVFTLDVAGIKQAIVDWGNTMKEKMTDNAKEIANTWANAYNNTINGKIEPVKQVVETETKNTTTNATTVTGGTQSGQEGTTRREELEMQVIQSKEKFDLLAQQEEDFTRLQYQELEKRKQKNTEWAETEMQNIENLKQAQQDLTNAKIEAAGAAIDALIQMAGEESTIGKALFLLNQARAVGQIIFNTGIANAKAVAASPLTGGQPWVAINTATSAASIATILGQTIAKFSAGKEYSEGGHTAPGQKYEPAGIVHAGEYVIPQEGTRNPNLTGIISMIEQARRSGSLQRLDPTPMQSPAARGYATGGYTATAAGSSVSPPSQGGENPATAGWGGSDPAVLDKLDQMISRIEKINVSVAIDKFEKERDKYMKIKQTSGL